MNAFRDFQILWLGAFLALGSCGSIPTFGGKIYAGDSAKGGISRNNPNEAPEFISAKDPLFDNYMSMSYADFKLFYQTYVLGCKSWSTGMSLVPAEKVLQNLVQQVPQLMR